MHSRMRTRCDWTHTACGHATATPLSQGPTGLLPRSQYFTRDHEGALQGEDQLDVRVDDGRMGSDELSQRDECLREAVAALDPDQPFQEMKAVVPAGTCVLMHYDIFHRATRRIPDDANVPWRAMLKFQFVRTTEPLEPSWDSAAGGAVEPEPFAFTGVRRCHRAPSSRQRNGPGLLHGGHVSLRPQLPNVCVCGSVLCCGPCRHLLQPSRRPSTCKRSGRHSGTG
jgi:hypothetical protein